MLDSVLLDSVFVVLVVSVLLESVLVVLAVLVLLWKSVLVLLYLSNSVFTYFAAVAMLFVMELVAERILFQSPLQKSSRRSKACFERS